MNTYPRLPAVPAQLADEHASDYGLRLFRFLVAERIPVTLLSRAQQEAALHFSLVAVVAPNVADSVRVQWHDIRHQLAAAVARPASAEAAPEATGAPQKPAKSGGVRQPRPVPPTRPTPPSTGVSLLTGQTFDLATALARVQAARDRAQQDGGAL